MTQTRTDIQVGQLRDAAITNEQFDGKRPTIAVQRDEIVCTTEEVKGTSSDLLSLRAAVQRVHDAEDEWKAACDEGVEVYEPGKKWREARVALREEMATINGKEKM